MEKLETPVVAGVGGVAILAALLSVFGGSAKESPQASPEHNQITASADSSPAPGVLPNQDGPWRAVCQEYAPNLSFLRPNQDASNYRKALNDELEKNEDLDSAQKALAILEKSGGDMQPEAHSATVAKRDNALRNLGEARKAVGVFEGNPGLKLPGVSRGYKTTLQPSNSYEGSSEFTVNKTGINYKVAVRKRLVGDLPSCIPPDELGKIRIVVATLPDPDKTEMGLEFDRYITALEYAAALRGYDYSGYWFPWRPRDNSPAPKKEDEVEAQLLREEQPGVLLFHNSSGERLLLFVVGETSTSGINRMQMAQALVYRQQLIDCYNGCPVPKDCTKCSPEVTPVHHESDLISGPLLIAGPHFSGALPSLWEILQSVVLTRDPNAQIVIDSPDASSGPLIEGFKSKCATAPRCSFRSISISADRKDQAAVDYLRSIGYDHSRIAELIEDESAFGIVESAATSHFDLKLTYPRELSAVRALSDKQSEQVAASGSKFLSLFTTPSTVKLSGGEPLERDRPFVYADNDEVTEVSNALADDIQVLRQKDIECVVITASNPLDRIYLLEYFHDKLPNVRLAVEDADELEINHPQFIDLAGTITISSLPVLPEIVEFTKARDGSTPPQHLAFASVAAEEEFLATAMLLGDDPVEDPSQEDGLTVSIVGEQGFHFIPFRESFEPIGTQSKGSLYEEGKKVELFGHESPRNQGGLSPEQSLRNDISIQFEQSEQIPKAFIVFSLFIYVATLFHLVWVARAEHPLAILKKHLRGEETNPCTPHWAYGARTGDPVLDFGRVYNLFVLNNQLFLLNLLILCAVPELPHSTQASDILAILSSSLVWVKLGAWVGLFVTGLVAIIYLCEYAYRIAMASRQPSVSLETKVQAWIYFTITIWYVLAGAIFLISWHSTALMEWRRTLSLDEGISPVVPVAAVLFGWSLWGVVQMRRAKWVASRKVDPISGVIGPMSRVHYELHASVRRIQAEIDQTGISWRRMVALFATVSLTSYWQWTSLRGIEPEPSLLLRAIPATIEKRTSHELYRLLSHFLQVNFPNSFHSWFAFWGCIMLLTTLIIATYQLYKIWDGLSRLLHRLENTSMKEAFEKLGLDDKVQIKIWDLGKAKMRYSEMFLTIKCLRSISGTRVASKAEAALNDYERADFRHCQVSLAEAEKLHKALTRGIVPAMALLEGISTVAKDSALEAELRRYLALRFVTFIRYVLLQMRNLMWFVVYGYFFACLSIKLYPFQGGKSLGELLGVTFFIVLAMVGIMITGMLRNPMLRLLEDKDSNAAGVLQVFLHLVTVGGVPLLALLAWQFPWIGQIAFSWLRPLWGVIH